MIVANIMNSTFAQIWRGPLKVVEAAVQRRPVGLGRREHRRVEAVAEGAPPRRRERADGPTVSGGALSWSADFSYRSCTRFLQKFANLAQQL